MLEGLHDHWLGLGHKNEITFLGLAPGKYMLKVIGSNNDGVWNTEGTAIRIIITPPFWVTWWFRLLVVLLLVGVVFLWHRRRMKNLTLRLKTEAQLERIFSKYKISQREQEIVHLLLKGKSNKDIEDELYISIKTVKAHIYNVYKKFNVSSRLELINFIQKSVLP